MRNPEQDQALNEIDKHATKIRPDAIVDPGDGRPVARKPWLFLSDPPTVGDPNFLQEVREAQRAVPYGDVNKIVQGNTEGSIGSLIESGFKPEDFPLTNLFGVYNKVDKSIGINPRVFGDDLRETLIHELAHSRGLREKKAGEIGAVFNLDPIARVK